VNATRTDGGVVIGIDLGTTNSAMSWTEGRAAPRSFGIPQLVASHEVEKRPVLPSFLYLPTDAERRSGSVALPWEGADGAGRVVVGELARDHGALTPARQIASAKSWLANPSVDRTAAILPWGADADVRLSPVDASARLLRHLRDAWNFERGGGEKGTRLERQSVVLTVPASFDEEARELTVQAAREAGLGNLRLLEEPLAALYAWIAAHRRSVADHLREGELVLVCDVGGGTTDFTLIRVNAQGSELKFERVAVGDHLLLGGDNLDLALASQIEKRLLDLGTPRLTLTQRQELRRKASVAKEQLLSDDSSDRARITLAGSGRGLIAGAMSAELTRDDVVRALADGFLPLTSANDLPAHDRRAGLRELGLPYEGDPAITRHLAAFLTRAGRAAGASSPVWPDVVLFNGGFFAPALARERVLDALEHWHGRRPRLLVNARPEIAVATGAAFYGRLLRDPHGAANLLIAAGSARTYYAGIAGGRRAAPDPPVPRAVCVMPRGTQEGTTFALAHEFTVAVNKPLAFPLYSSTERADALNDVVELPPEGGDIHVHAPLVTSFRYGKRSRHVELRVRLEAAFTETGTLELWCSSTSTDHRWRLAFQLRGVEELPEDADAPSAVEAAAGEAQILIEDAAVDQAVRLVREVFASGAAHVAPETLTGELESVLGHGRHAWPLAVLRKLADTLLAVEPGRRRGAPFETRWLNLTGFCTRPGFGSPLDAWRVSELRKTYAAGLACPRDVQAQVEWLVLWQRVGAGFSAGQQRELAQRIAAQVGVGQRKPPRINPQIEREGWRLLGSLERLDIGLRTKLGEELLQRIKRDQRNGAWLWTLGRLGARTPLYGPLSSVPAPATAAAWVERLLALKTITEEVATTIVQIASLTGDPARDLASDVRSAAADRIRAAGHPDRTVHALLHVSPAGSVDAARLFGEPLPEGLRLEPAGTNA
jgi:molecular chaperone DnaK (HSP70)